MIGKMLPGLMSLDFCCNIQIVWSESGVKKHESMDPSCLVSTVQAGGGVVVWGTFMALLHCMVRHGTVWYGSLLGGFPLGTVPGTFLVPPRPGFQAIRTVTKT